MGSAIDIEASLVKEIDAERWIQCGREFSAQEIQQVRDTVAWLPGLARRELAETICEHLNWHTASGTPKTQACQNLLKRLESAEQIKLPPLRRQHSTGKGTTISLSVRTEGTLPIAGRLHDFEPVRLDPVTETSEVKLWNEYVERFHPLGYKGAFGYRLRYFICSGSIRLGCVLLAGAARAIAVRDQWIGWDKRLRLHNLSQIVNNTRFLIFPHARIPHLASHVLGQLARRVKADWQYHWGFSPQLLETFVDPERYGGTCYRAAGWELLGNTTGRGLARPGKQYQSTPRLIFVKPLDSNFRHQLCLSTTRTAGE
jgi:hypothetical protein